MQKYNCIFEIKAPFLSGGGYCNEAIGFVTGLYDYMDKIKIVQHGDGQNERFVNSIPNDIWQKFTKMTNRNLKIQDCLSFLNHFELFSKNQRKKAFVICHSQPFGWVPRGYAASPYPDVWCPSMASSGFFF